MRDRNNRYLNKIKWNFLPRHLHKGRQNSSSLSNFNENLVKSRPSTAVPSSSSKLRLSGQRRPRPSSAIVKHHRQTSIIKHLTFSHQERKNKEERSFRQGFVPFANGALSKYLSQKDVAKFLGSTSFMADTDSCSSSAAAARKTKISVEQYFETKHASRAQWDRAWGIQPVKKLEKESEKEQEKESEKESVKESEKGCEIPLITKMRTSLPLKDVRKTTRRTARLVLNESPLECLQRNMSYRKVASLKTIKMLSKKNKTDPESIEFLSQRYNEWVNKTRVHKTRRRRSVTLDRMLGAEKLKKIIKSVWDNCSILYYIWTRQIGYMHIHIWFI